MSVSNLHPRAVEFFNQGVAYQHTDPQLSYKLVTSALDIEPEIPGGWGYIGSLNRESKFPGSALACFRRAIEIDISDGKAWTNLGHALYDAGKIEESKFATLRALELDDKLAMAWLNLSLVQSIECDVHASVKSAKRAFELDPTPETELGLGFAYLHARDLRRGLKHFEAKLPYKMPNHLQFPWARWSGEDLSDKTLLIMSDQGMGDTLDYMRFIPLAANRARRVILQIQGEMSRLAQMMLQDHHNIEFDVVNSPFPDADFWVPITSLPVALDLSGEEIEHTPQLSVPTWERQEGFRAWLTPKRKLHIGIAWAGATGNEIDRHRSMLLDHFIELYRVPGIQLYSFQVGERSKDVHITGCVSLVKDMTLFIRDVADTVGFLRELDLVIAVESFLPHLCNAISVPVWIPYGRLGGDWRVGRKGQRSIWHEHSRIFHQHKDATWAPVIDDIAGALHRKVANG